MTSHSIPKEDITHLHSVPYDEAEVYDRLLTSERKVDKVEQQVTDLQKAFKVKMNDPLEGVKWKSLGDNHMTPGIFEDGSILELEEDDGLDVFKLYEDIYAFMLCYKFNTCQFCTAIGVVIGVQMGMIILLLYDSIDFHDPVNPLQVAGNIDQPVRVTQILALVVAVFYEDDFRKGIEGLLLGMPSQFRAHSDLARINSRNWNFVHALRFFAGGIDLLASFMLLVQSNSVFDVLLNFLGISFVSQLDELAFFLCGTGYFGYAFKKSSKMILNAEFKQENHQLDNCLSKIGLTGCRVAKYGHSVLLNIAFVVVMAGYIYLTIQQLSGAFITETIRVEFGDEIVPFLGIFNGCYQKSSKRYGNRIAYTQIGFEKEGGIFAYCEDVDGHPSWTFSSGAKRDPCKGWHVMSGETKTFELYEAGKENWYTPTNAPVEFIQISKIKDSHIECGRGMFEKLRDSCEKLEPVGALSVMSMFKSDFYEKLMWNSSEMGDYLDESHSHPIYIHGHDEGNHTDFDIVLFSGRRWVLTDTDHIDELHDASVQNRLDLESIRDYFKKPKNVHDIAESKQHWISLLSEKVSHTKDTGTPVDLKWFAPEYHYKLAYSFPSTSILPEDIIFECLNCDNSTHPCKNGGFCPASGKCDCVNGALGAHCQDKPLSDGRCDTFFNKKVYNYDGGDCCGGSCNGLECGYDGLHSAFNKTMNNSAFGFEHCQDPENAVITLEWKNIQKRDYCDNAETFCAIVSLNLRCDGKTYFDIPELRFDADEDCDGPFHQIVLVPYGSTCHLNSSQDWYDIDYDFAMYYGMDETKSLIHKSNQDTHTVWFHIPSHCFSDVLREHVNSYFDDSVQANVVQTLSKDTISDRMCIKDHDLLLERYALKVLNASIALDTSNIKAHQCQGWGGSAVKIGCDEDHKINYLFIKTPRQAGTIPTELTLLTKLKHLNFYNTSLTGTVPVGLSTLTHLEFLDLGATGLTGSIPTELFLLTNMNFLGLFENSLSGSLPSEIGLMQQLTNLDLHDNQLSGTIHTEIGLLSNLYSLKIGSNNVSGTIPSEIGLAHSLRELSLSHLVLQGSLPSEIGLLTDLTKLKLMDIGLTGTIPFELQSLSRLTYCNLGNNKFSGGTMLEICASSTANQTMNELSV